MHCITLCRKFEIAKDSRNFVGGEAKFFLHHHPSSSSSSSTKAAGGGSRRVHLLLKGGGPSFLSLSQRTWDSSSKEARTDNTTTRALKRSHGGEESLFRGDDGQENPTQTPLLVQKHLQQHYRDVRILAQITLIWRSLQYSSIPFDYWLANRQTPNRGKPLRISTGDRSSSSSSSSSSLQKKTPEDAQGRTEVRIRSRQKRSGARERNERYVEFLDLREDDGYTSHGRSSLPPRAASLTMDFCKNHQAPPLAPSEPRFLRDLARAFLVNRVVVLKKIKRGLLLPSQVKEKAQRLAVFRWLERLSKTYGTSFMVMVIMGYCTQGFRCFPWLAMSYYYKDTLQVAPAMMQFLMSTANLPMVAKPIYGIISDSVFIGGAHRVPYLIFAGALQMLSWGAIVVHPGVSSSVVVLTFILTLSNMGAAISEVMNDALVAEAGKKKKGAQQGELQSLAWLALASGGLVGNLMGGYALQKIGFGAMFCLFITLVGAQLLVCVSVKEGSFGLRHPKIEADDLPVMVAKQQHGLLVRQKSQKRRIYSRTGYTTVDLDSPMQDLSPQVRVPKLKMFLRWQARVKAMLKISSTNADGTSILSSMQQQVSTLGDLLRNPEIGRPLIWFLSSYAIIPSLGSSIFFYQTQHLGLSSSVIGLARVVGQMGLLAGSIIYNKSLKKVPLRKMFGSVQILLAICMLSDIILVNRVNLQLGVPDKYFVLGASAFVDAIGQFKVLPFLVLLARLCPPGNEGSLFAFFMSAHCLACTASAYFGVGLASYLHISSTSFTGLPLGIFMQALFTLLPVLWINFIPEDESSTTEMCMARVK